MKKIDTLQVLTPTPSEAANNELIIADGGAADIRELLHGSPLPTLLLHGASEPLLAITNALQDSPRDTLHLVAHGRSDGFMLGGYWIDANCLRESASLLAQWRLDSIALWICQAGANRELVELFARLTGAEVHATPDFLGWVNNIASWQLPLVQTGSTSLSLPSAENNFHFPFQAERAQSWRSQLAGLTFDNAYAVNTATSPAGKEQNSIDFGSTALGSVTITDGTNGLKFSGNDVVVKLTINGIDHYGWISRPIKSGGKIKGFYFWEDSSFTDLTTATADGNSDADGDANNIGFVLVVDQAFFDGLNVSGGLKSVGSSSDRVDSSLNKVLPVNSPPAAVNDSAIFLEDSIAQTGNILSNDTDTNGNTLTVSSFSIDGSPGTLGSAFTIAGVGSFTLSSTGAYSFTAVAHYSGAVPAITYIVSDGTLTSTGNLAIALTEVNDAPSGADKTITSQENQSYTFSAADFGFSDTTDTPANALQSVVITTLPGAGTLKLNGSDVIAGNEVSLSDISKLIFTPASNEIGTGYASFTFQVRDNGGTSNSGINLDASANTLTFNISNLNSAPTAVADIETAVEAGGASNATTGTNPTGNVLTNDTDPDSGDTKTVLSAKSAAASDTTVATDTSITGVYGTLVISTDGSYTYTVNNSNVEVEALRVNANTLTDTFNYTMEDTAGLKSSSTLTVTVQGANDNPNGVNDNAIAKESIVGSGNYDVSDVTGYQATGNVLNNDTDVDSAANGETSKTVAGLSGTATANVVGSANVSSKIVFTAASTLNPVSGGDYLYIVIGGIERALYNAGGDHITVVSKTEVSTDNYEFVLSSTPAAYYDVDATDTKIAYTIASGAVIAFNANTVNADPNGATKTATVSSSSETGNSTSTLTSISGAPAAGMTVTGTGVPAGTTIESIAYDGSNNPTLTFSSIVTTTTGQAFTFSADAGATLTGRYGSLVLNSDGSYTYTPTANNAVLSEGGSGTESFTYRVKDTLNTEDTAVLTIKVLGSGSNDPDANADTVTAVEAGTAAGTNPTDNVITNDTTPSGTGTLSVNNAAKSGAAETAVTAATDITGLYGTLNIDTDGAYTYTVDNSNGTVNALRTSSNTLTDTFNYKVINSSSKVSEGTLTVTVQGANDAPVAVADTSSAYEAGGVGNGTTGSNPSGNLLSNDTDVDTGDGKSVTAFSTSGSSAGTLGAALTGTYGSLTVSSNGSYTYTVDNSNSTVQALGLGQTVSESFNYTDADTAGATSSSTLTVTVNGANDAPVNTVPGTNPSVSEAGTVSISGVSVADVDSASLTVTLTVLNGTVSVTAGTSTVTNSGTATVTITGTLAAINTALDTLSYTGASDFNGTDTLKIVASDGSLTDTDTLDITVTADNRSLSVSGTTVNEASPYAMFQVTGVASQKVSLTLGSTASTGDTDASSSTDFLPNMQYYNGSAWTTYSGGLVSIPSGGSTMLVRVPVLNDNSDELDETFTLTASNKAGTGSTPAISTIVDDGNGSVFLGSNNSFSANGISDAGYPATLDDDRALTVNNISVNENSTYAVFQVGGAAGQVITLAQAAGSATADTDYGSTLEVWNGTTSTWGNYGSSATIPAGGVLLVRSTVTDDATYEGAETFGLRATNGGGVGYTGTATILDDGTGLIYDGTVTGNTATTTSSGLDNDLSISVSASTPVSENSTYAMFSVTATAGSALTLAVAGSGTTQATTSSFVIEFSTDAGGTWTTYSASSTPLVAGTLGSGTGTVAVRVQISSEQDTTFEGAETFSLTATMAAGGNTPLSGAAEATIIDNGTGASYDGTLSGGTPVSSSTGLDDDTPTLSVSSVTVSEASAFANFTVSLSNASTTAISFTPSLSSGTATVGSDTGNTPSTAAIEYYDGSSWVSAVSGVSIGANNTSVVLRTAITNDSVLETSESFTLTTGTITGTVTNSGAASGTATIKDDGSSTNVFLVDNFTGVPTTGAADNDTAGAGLTITGSSLTTSETGTDASFTVKLNSQPSADVTVTLTGLDGTEGSLSTSTLTFTSANWNTAQTITISGLDDTLDDGDISYTLTATSSSSDANYDGANARTGTVGVTNTDTDVAPSLSIDDVSASEDAGTFLFTVTRSGATGGTTTVDYATANGTALAGSDYTAQSGSLSFAPGETSKTISVSINDDSVIEGSEAFTVGLTNIDDASSSAESISDNSGGGTINDNDSAGLTITGSSLTTSETGTDASFTVKLNSQPSADVTVTLTGLDGTEGSLSTSTLTFTSANWNTAQTITISGLDDTLDDGDISYTLTATSSSSDANYDGANARTGTVGVTNTDTDVAPSLSIDDVSASEDAGTFLFTVTRSGATGGTTTVDYATANGTALAGSDYTAQSGSLSFAPGETSKTISVSINDDSVIEGSEAFTVGLTNIDDASSSAESISDNSGGGTINDNDTAGAGLTITGSSLTTSETGTDASFTVKLNSQPSADVTVTLTGLDGTEGSLSTSTLTFTSANWNTAQTITISGLDDTLDDGDISYTLTATSSSSDANYDGANARTGTVGVTNTDTDVAPSLSIDDVSGSEDAGTFLFTVTRSGATGGTTTVDYATANGTALAGSDYTAQSGSLSFAPGETSKTISVSINDDSVIEGSEAFTVGLTNIDDASSSAESISDNSGGGTINDNDTAGAGLTITGSSLTTSETGTDASFTVKLNSQPSADVTVTLTGLDGTEGSLSTSTLTFTSANWNTAQTITISGLDDTLDDGDISYTLTATSSSSDANYDGANARTGTVGVTNTDTDVAPSLSIDDVSGSEDAGTFLFTVTRSGATGGTTTVDYATANGTALAGSDYTAQSGSLSFAPGETSKTISVSINDDSVAEGSEAFTVGLTNSDDASSSAESISGNSGGGTINDNDSAGLTITGSSLTTRETGTDASFTVKLNSQPSADVTVTLTGLDGTEGSLSTSTLTFTSANWNTAQTITISGLDDTLDDGDISYTLAATSSSSDANYDGANARTGTVGVTNTDTDVAPSLSIDDVSASESAGTFLFTVTRSGATGGTTTVDYATANGTALAGSDYTAQSGSLSFAPGETSKTISVSINDDSVAEGSEAFTVGLTNIDDASSSAESISDNSGGGTIIDKDKRVEPPVITDVTEITTDPTPFDLLTNDVTQLIQVQGAAGHTLRLYTADNVLIPTSNYTVTEKSSGSYEIDARGINLLAGDYVVRQIDANDNESQNSNAFTIDSTPEVQDNINARVPLPEGGMNGSLSVIDQNRLDLTDLQSTSPPVNWFDSDGENVVFGIAGVQVVNNISTSVLASGSTLTLNAVDGSYVYKPSANAVIDIFTTTVRDPGGKGGNLNLTFEVRDLLDRDGISGNTEDELAKLVTGGQKDRNKDGLDDSVQNSVTTLAWVRQENFAEAVAGNFANVPNSSVITIIAHKSTEGEEASAIAQLIGIEVLNLDVSGNGIISTNGLDGISTPWDPIKFSVEPLQSLGLIDIDNERDGLQVRLSINISEAAVPEDGFSGYMKYISADVIIAAQQAGVLLTTFDGETLSETSQAGWYDFMQRTPGGDGARFIVQDGIIVSIELILTDNAFGDVDFTIGRLTDPGMPVAQEEAMPALITGPSGGKGAVASQKFISENSTVVTQFIANEAVAWTLADSQDDSLFELYADGTLVFKAAPDYEAAQDSDLDNNYELLVQAIDFSGNVSEQQVTVTVTDVLEAAPIYAAEIGNNDHYLSGLASDAQAQQLSATNPLRIEFYVFPTQQDDTLPLKAWVNTITGDFFYAPEGTPPPYACYIAFDAIGLGYVYEAGQGDFDVHLFMNEEGITQIMGIETASELGLASAGYTDIGVLFASSEAPYTVVELTGVSDLPINDFLI